MKEDMGIGLASVPQGSLEGKMVEAEEGHELILQALAANNVECLFFCGGTDNFMFMESIKKFAALNRPHPNLYTCLHESAAVYAAYGYYMVTGRPQAVILHVDCGTLNAGGAWVNSWHGNAGIVVMAGRAPWTSQGELPGSRNGGVFYTQEPRDQGAIVRQYVKWDFELKTAKNAGLVIQRAFRIASSEPCGPVYLTLPRETLLEKLPGGKGMVYSPESFAPSVSPQGDLEALKAAAKLLAEAKNPLISVRRMGRNPGTVKHLIDLAEKLAVPVLHNETTYLNFPFDHPLLVPNSQSQGYIEKADVILFIDQKVPWIHSNFSPPKNCKIITLDIDPMRLAQPTWDFPVHLPITCDSAKAVPVLSLLAEEFVTPHLRQTYHKRKEEMEIKARTNAEANRANVEKARSAKTITPAWLGACVNEVVDDNTIVVQGIASGITPGPKSRPGQYFGLPASSLGWAMPAAIGAKLAAPDKTVISASGDGSTVFANPEACLWMERKYKIPTLHIVTNNSRYAAVSYSLLRMYEKGYCVTDQDFNGYDLSPSIDFSIVAKSCGAYGEKVETPAQLPLALQRALSAVKSGQGAVLDVALP